jgi:hypothetical protein
MKFTAADEIGLRENERKRQDNKKEKKRDSIMYKIL